MSFEPITRWVLRCDGLLRHHRPCPDLLVYRYDATTCDAAHAGHGCSERCGHADSHRGANRCADGTDSVRTPRDLPAHTPPDDSTGAHAESAGPHAAPGAVVWVTAVFDRPILSRDDDGPLRAAGWLRLRDGRVLCPRHVAALEYVAHAELDGLPFEHGGTA